jgi:hypothetical protein
MKAHLTSSDTPLKAGGELGTACGTDVKHAYFAMSVDTSGVTGRTMASLISANSLLLCKKCMVAPLPGKYVYLVTEAQEVANEVEG